MAQHAVILGFDTSAAHCAAALLCHGEVVAARHEDMARGQAERLFPLLQEVLDEAGLAWGALSAIAVGTGPGNFTGIRISVAAARGLALSLDIPAMGVSLLEAVAHGTPGPRLSCLAARRGAVYVQSHDMATDIAPCVMAVADVPRDWAQEGLVCLGSGAQDVAAQLGAVRRPAAFAPASAIARLAAQRSPAQATPPKPFYLRAADAAPASDRGPVILDDA